jgi:hypothetical protein
MKAGAMKCSIILSFVLLALLATAGCMGDPNGRTRYCGVIQYDIYEGHCCAGTLYSSYEWAYGSVSCCNDVKFNRTDQMCCNGVVQSSVNQHCCNGKVEPGGGNWQDCGSRCYDQDTNSCCRDTVYSTATQDCCSGVVYNNTDQGCCNKKTVYSKAGQHCCNGKVEAGGGDWYECTSGQCYETRTQSCCVDGKTFSVREGAGSCCEGRPAKINQSVCQPFSGLYESPHGGGATPEDIKRIMEAGWRNTGYKGYTGY